MRCRIMIGMIMRMMSISSQITEIQRTPGKTTSAVRSAGENRSLGRILRDISSKLATRGKQSGCPAISVSKCLDHLLKEGK